MRRLKTALLLSLVFILTPALTPIVTCQAQVDFSQTVSFGDSLTDNDLLYLLFPGTDPSFYGLDPVEAVFEKGAREYDQLTNNAVLGSRSSDVLAQVNQYVADRQAGFLKPATFFSLQAGGNDFLDLENNSANLFLLASARPFTNPDADRITRDLMLNLLKSVFRLQDSDHVEMTIWTVPDLTKTPYVLSFGLSANETRNVQRHIRRVNRFIRILNFHPRIAVLDSYSILTSMTWDPPVICGVTIVPTPLFGFHSAQFADPIHPTAVANAMVSNELIELLNDRFDDDIPYYTENELAELALIGPCKGD